MKEIVNLEEYPINDRGSIKYRELINYTRKQLNEDGCCGDEVLSGCDETCGSTLEFDECGVCDGDGIADGACDCDGNVDAGCGCGESGPSGCDNECGSTLENDDCGVCDGGNADQDCAGECFGTAEDDNCGVCSGGNSCQKGKSGKGLLDSS